MVKALVIASFVWPIALGLAVWQRAEYGTSMGTALLYMATSRICHQRPERSFHTAGVQWPVCGRCSGLYIGAPIGALAALLLARRRRGRRAALIALAVAAVPTAATMTLEWLGAPMTSELRAIAAVPLGAAVVVAMVSAIDRAPDPIR